MQPRERILIIENDPVQRDLLMLGLRRHGFQVYSAGTPEAAQEQVWRRQPHLLLINLLLPGSGGLELLAQFRRHGLPFSTPVIFISSLGISEVVSRAIAAGGTDFVMKPFEMDDLVKRIINRIHPELSKEGATDSREQKLPDGRRVRPYNPPRI
jgi:DNA-binding response OmpR family regulator